MEVFTKRPAQPQAARAEAAGLRWLGEASPQVAEVVSVDDHHISTRAINLVPPTPTAARAAGRALARIHRAGAPAFGSPPAGWEGPNYIGTQQQSCFATKTWGEFYATQRVLPFAQRAKNRNHIDGDTLELIINVCARIQKLEVTVAPARIHGDLWAGNLLFGDSGPVFIDPAAHGGHPETDLAMLDLFGAPYLSEIQAGYEEISPLPSGWRERIPLHQLHPLAVHAASHGPSYGRQLRLIALEVSATTYLAG
ncbi:fructosamine kinase family protein [Corynebacterium callunae]|uniref:fructosamine kinase family protein n=1 Tax=Corynebacterium callunae TaxID=1721 RepID=UPI0039821449